MKCAVMQPTYLPWAGYFSLIASVDYFYYLDCVQYSHHDWNNRNRILLSGQPHWLTVPIRRQSLKQKMTDTFIDEQQQSKWRRKHCNTLRHAYSSSPYIKQLDEILSLIEEGSQRLLIDLNMDIIDKICHILDIQTKKIRASHLSVDNLQRSERIVALCSHIGCTCYVSPPGAKNYLDEDGFWKISDMDLLFHHFLPEPYRQFKRQHFVSHLSILDVIASLGIEGTKNYLKSCHFSKG